MLTLLLLFLLFHNRLAIQNLLNVHQLARLSITKYYGQGGLNNRISLSLQYGVQESEIKVLAGLVSPRPLSLACRWPSFPCFVFTWLSLCAHTSAVSLCVLISFYNNTRYIRLRPTLMMPFKLFTSLKTSNIVTL